MTRIGNLIATDPMISSSSEERTEVKERFRSRAHSAHGRFVDLLAQSPSERSAVSRGRGQNPSFVSTHTGRDSKPAAAVKPHPLSAATYRNDLKLPSDYEIVEYVSKGVSLRLVGTRQPMDTFRFQVRDPETGKILTTLKQAQAEPGFVWLDSAYGGLRAGAPDEFDHVTPEALAGIEGYHEGMGRFPDAPGDPGAFTYVGLNRMFCQAQEVAKSKTAMCDLLNGTMSHILNNFPKENPIIIHSFGSNGLFLEHMLVLMMQSAGYKNLALRLIDPAYDENIPQEEEYLEVLRGARADFGVGKENLDIKFYPTISAYIREGKGDLQVSDSALPASHLIFQASEPVLLDFADDDDDDERVVGAIHENAAFPIPKANIERAESIYAVIQPDNDDGQEDCARQMEYPYGGLHTETDFMFSLTADGKFIVRVGDSLSDEPSTFVQERVNAHLESVGGFSDKNSPIEVLNEAVTKSLDDLQRAWPGICAMSTPVADYHAGYQMQQSLVAGAANRVIRAELQLGKANIEVMRSA